MTSVYSLLQNQHKQLSTLLTLLDKELELISARDPEALQSLVEEKSALLNAIQDADNRIDELIKQRNGVQFSDQEQVQVDDIQALLLQCKRATSINEKALEQGQVKLAHLRQLLIDIRAKESLTYDKSGKAKGGTFGKGIKA